MNLPIDKFKDELCQAFQALPPSGRLVLTAPTGSGKSTRVPPWCEEWREGKVLVIEPRRVAARTLAEWVAKGRGERVGQSVGYVVRFENRSGPQTQILFVTPGVARRFLTENSLKDFSVIVFDEFHERSWETDALLALLAARAESPKLLLMSATLDAESLAIRYQAPLLQAHGRSFPVEVKYLEQDSEITIPSPRGLATRAARVIKTSWQEEADGSILVFLPGLSSMHELAGLLTGLPVVLLHGSYSPSEQARAFVEEERKIVLATNVAESSLTIPGITTVVDSGLERRQIHQSGYVALATVPVAMSSAEQRAGRAGRVRPGRCLRLWKEQARLEATRPPDLCRMELDDLLLFFAALPEGLASPAEWLDHPPEFAWQRAQERLLKNGLLTEEGFLSPVGRDAQALPVDQEWARVLVAAPAEWKGDLCDLCALATARRSPLKSTRSEDHLTARKRDWGEEPWAQALNVLRLGDPDKHALAAEGLSQCRKVSDELRELCGVGERPTVAGRLAQGLQLYLAQAWPQRFFVLRGNRQAWGNGEVECRLARGEDLPPDCLAAFMLQVEPILNRGLKVDLQARWGLPVALSLLRQAGLGEAELSKIRWIKGKLSARLLYRHAGREIGSCEQELSGSELRKALAQLASEGRWKVETLERMLEEQFYADLQARLEETEFVLLSPQELMENRLQTLGVKECEDLELLEEEDFLSGSLEEQRKLDLAKDYPKQYRFAGLTFDLSYDPPSRRVTMHSLSQTKGLKLNPQHLPRWQGWRVELDERGRRTVLRP